MSVKLFTCFLCFFVQMALKSIFYNGYKMVLIHLFNFPCISKCAHFWPIKWSTPRYNTNELTRKIDLLRGGNSLPFDKSEKFYCLCHSSLRSKAGVEESLPTLNKAASTDRVIRICCANIANTLLLTFKAEKKEL